MRDFKSGTYINQGTYKSFQPDQINRKWQIDDPELITLLSLADRQIGRLDMYSEYIPDIDWFIQMHVRKEATQSSKIEGTQTNMEEALMDWHDIAEEKRDDWFEVQNYVGAMEFSINSLKSIPISTRLIKRAHKRLMHGVRGKNKLPGEFRTSQNWIGGATLGDAVFIPPHHSEVSNHMNDLEKFVHNDEHHFPELLKIALVHYQFETIHPFLDGNGRIGRLLITLFLVEKGILKRPVLYLSDYFEKNRSLYFDNLMKVREQNDIIQWFKFFLVGVIETAKNSITTFDRILKLGQEMEGKIAELGSRAQNGRLILKHLYTFPLTDAQSVQDITKQSLPSCYTLIDKLEEIGLLHEITGTQRGKKYIFKEYLQLFK